MTRFWIIWRKAFHRKGLRRGFVLLIGLLCVAALAGGGGYQALTPPAATGKSVRFSIPTGWTLTDISRQLQKQGLIRNAWVFETYVRWRYGNVQFQAGDYQIPVGSGVSELVHVLERGGSAGNVVNVTIPEGYTVAQIAARLQASNVCSATAFVKEVQTGTFSNSFLQSLPASAHVKYRLEGYLFPDTYQFSVNESAHDVVQEMLDTFEEQVVHPLGAQIQHSGLSLSQVITEASLVEREARVSAERPVIASVIQNRLHKGMKLQIDATLEYILGHRDVVTIQDTRVNDPYNTYLHQGLPPGPIANPGLASIKAVLHPAKTNYLYYVVKNDGSGEHYFAVTYAEQLKNEARSAENLRTHAK
ncbi:endolytic transglycosylase MltG [Alicyclobacillus contaminans]|uniref:endolytic transglycosylase MltG n=1 Tax=Alicyclobacillus contaminans TaxID=392016 RepID=UPI00040B73DB|nr:endolytic transglycosylase MltG [Alicyclobacillus contaminans]